MKVLISIVIGLLVVGCGTTSWVSDPSDPNNVKIEKEIRKCIYKPTGELTKADLEKVKELFLGDNQLTDLKGMEKLTKLRGLFLKNNSDLTRAQIAELQKALPKCNIFTDFD